MYNLGFTVTSPITAVITTDTDADYALLSAASVPFRSEPKNMGPISTVIFEDSCGNLVNLVQPTM